MNIFSKCLFMILFSLSLIGIVNTSFAYVHRSVNSNWHGNANWHGNNWHGNDWNYNRVYVNPGSQGNYYYNNSYYSNPYVNSYSNSYQCSWVGGHYNSYGSWVPAHKVCR